MTDSTGSILVVDDSRIIRTQLSHNLKRQGHRVSLAESGENALELIKNQAFDVVLLDIMMPGMDGFAVLQHMKRDSSLKDIPVIVISALDEVDSAVRCIELGAEDYLPKPFDPVLLKARLGATLEKKKLRDIERAYLKQEVVLRQSEKLATLGKLSAGMAHEMNNPIAAIMSGTEHLTQAIDGQLSAHTALDRSGLSNTQIEVLLAWDESFKAQALQTLELDAFSRYEQEDALEQLLDMNGITAPWEITPRLVDMAFTAAAFDQLAGVFSSQQLTNVLSWLVSRYTIHSILSEISEGSKRVADIVKALKSFTYLDQAPIQKVDIHEGLSNTLIMLRNKLKKGITVHEDYTADLPLITVHGTELNQMWTNIIENAIDAMGGQGELIIRTFWDDPWVVTEIEDNGPGIPEDIQSNIFDPFFTTKEPGKGTGLGMNISYNIVHKHAGTLSVTSQPGQTCFRVQLPRTQPESLSQINPDNL